MTTNIHALSRIRTLGLSVQAIKTYPQTARPLGPADLYSVSKYYRSGCMWSMSIYLSVVVLGGIVVSVPLDPWFAGSNPAEGDWFLRAIKIRVRFPSGVGGGVKSSVPCRKFLRHVIKNPTSNTDNSTDICRHVFPVLPYVCAGNCQRALVNEYVRWGRTTDQKRSRCASAPLRSAPWQ
jgi:hypothetical protein